MDNWRWTAQFVAEVSKETQKINNNKMIFPYIYLVEITEGSYFYCHIIYAFPIPDSEYRIFPSYH